MSPFLWIAIAALALVIFLFMGKEKPLLQAIGQTKASGDIAPILSAIGPDKEADPTLWDMAINALWQAHAREAAADLIVVSIEKNDADVLHFWAQKVMEVEPEIARERFSEDFLKNKFRPEGASCCGKCGCG